MLRVCRMVEKVRPSTATVMMLGESGTGKELLARGAARTVAAARRALRRHQLRGDSREPARKRAVRLREGRLHGREQADPGKIEIANRRHVVPRRDRRHADVAAGQAAAVPAGAVDRAARRAPGDRGRRAHRLRHPPGPQAPDRRRPVPRRPVLSTGRDRDRNSAAARPSRRCRIARSRICAEGGSRAKAPFAGVDFGGDCQDRRPRLAGQRS